MHEHDGRTRSRIGSAKRCLAAVAATLLGVTGMVVATASPAAALSSFTLDARALTPLVAGTSSEIEFSVYNGGPDVAEDTTLEVTLPDGLTAVAGAGCVSPAACLIGSFGLINVGETTTRRMTVAVAPDFVLEAGGDDVAPANIGLGVDYDAGAQSGSRDIPVHEQADLRVTAATTDTDVVAGETFTYTVMVDNLGPSVARDVAMTTTLVGVEPASALSLTGCAFSVSLAGGVIDQFDCHTGPVVTGFLGQDLGTFSTDRLDPMGVITPPGGDPLVGGRLRMNFSFVANEGLHISDETRVVSTTPDPDPSNNVDSSVVAITSAADQGVVIDADATATPGGPLSYAVTATNLGPSATVNSVVEVDLPAGVSLVEASTPGGTCVGGPPEAVRCNLGAIAFDDLEPLEEIITIEAEVDAAVSPGTDLTATAFVTSDVLDLDNTNDAAAAATAVEAAENTFEPIVPVRVLDTRDGTGGFPIAKIPAGVSVPFTITGDNGIPVGASAVSISVTVMAPNAVGKLAIHPCSSPLLPSTVLNFPAATTLRNAMIAPVDGAGAVCFRSTTPTHLIVDASGWLPGGSGFTPINPNRVFDTRTGAGGVPVGRRPAGSILSFDITGAGGVPGSGVSAVALNLTATGLTVAGKVAAFPCGDVPVSTNLNLRAGETRGNLVVAPVSPGGRVCFYTSSAMHLIADVQGWFATDSDLHPLTPTRVVDTRLGQGAPKLPIAGGTQIEVDLTGAHGVPSDGVGAVVLNLAAVNGSSNGYLTAFACGDRPTTSNLYFTSGARAVAGAAIVPVDADGHVCFYASRQVDLAVDIFGWFEGEPAG